MPEAGTAGRLENTESDGRMAGKRRLWYQKRARFLAEHRGGSHPAQQAFLNHAAAFQCGFCTPCLILGAAALLHQDSSPTAAVTREGLQGHVCRGGAYPQSVDAVRARQGVAVGREAAGSGAQMRQPLFTRPAPQGFHKTISDAPGTPGQRSRRCRCAPLRELPKSISVPAPLRTALGRVALGQYHQRCRG